MRANEETSLTREERHTDRSSTRARAALPGLLCALPAFALSLAAGCSASSAPAGPPSETDGGNGTDATTLDPRAPDGASDATTPRPPSPLGPPTVTGVSGAPAAGQVVTVTGHGFGAKNPVAPLKFDNFDDGTSGQELLAKDARWSSYSANGRGLLYSDTAPHSGALSVSRHVTNGESFITNYFTFTPAAPELFVSYWFKVVVVSAGSTIVKMPRLSSSEAAGGGGVYNGAGATTLGGTYNLGEPNAGPYCAYTSRADGSDESPLTGDWKTNYFDAPPRTTWYKVDSYKKLGTAGVADGIIDYRLGTQQKVNTAAMTRAAGATFMMDTVLLGGMDGSPANHDYFVYIDDVYIDRTRARVEVCDGARWAERTHCEIQLPVNQWADDTLQIRVNRGSFAAGSTQRLYVIDHDGEVNDTGYPITFP